ncbi:hypothetical protein D3C81_1210300 [compost metagenome]
MVAVISEGSKNTSYCQPDQFRRECSIVAFGYNVCVQSSRQNRNRCRFGYISHVNRRHYWSGSRWGFVSSGWGKTLDCWRSWLERIIFAEFALWKQQLESLYVFNGDDRFF